MRLLLTSAGITNQSIFDALTVLLEQDPSTVRAAFIPTAKNNRGLPIEEAMASQIGQLSKWGIPHIIVDPSFDADWQFKLNGCELVIIGGGNTFHLLNEARKTGFDKWLYDNKDTKVYLGTSAGSIIFTPNVAVAEVDNGDENTVGVTNLIGLSLVDFEISPHTPEDVRVEANLEYSESTPHRLLMLDNNGAIKVTDDELTIVSEGSWSWCKRGKILDE